jgi:hypothetical protein
MPIPKNSTEVLAFFSNKKEIAPGQYFDPSLGQAGLFLTSTLGPFFG